MKKDDLRTRGFGTLGKLIKTKGAEALPDKTKGTEALPDVLAWEREFITAFPQEKTVGVITPEEAAWSEGLTQKMDPDFTLAHRSTMLLDDGTPGATVFTNAVRLHRLQHSEGIGRTEEAPMRFTFSSDVDKGFSEHVRTHRDVTGKAPTEAQDIEWGKVWGLGRTRVMELRDKSPDRTSKDRRQGNRPKK